MWTLWMAASLAASPFSGLEGDVRATAELSLPPEQVLAAFSDVPRAAALFPDHCARDWTHAGGSEVVWTPSWVNRRLRVVPDAPTARRVAWDLQGRREPKGFWLVVDAVATDDGGSRVTVSTPLASPGWPIRRPFFQQVRPAWAACYAAALRALDPAARIVEVTGRVR